MNWLQKISQGKPFPLPFNVNVDDHNLGEGVSKIDDVMTQETADEEQRRYEDIYYLGAGQFGIAADLGNGMVLKYIKEPTEAVESERVMKLNPSCVTKIHEVRQLQDNLWGVIMDKVRLLDPIDIRQVTAMRNLCVAGSMTFREFIREARVKEFPTVDNWTEHLFNEYVEMMSCLRANDVYSHDMHGKNCGHSRTTGKLVAFDIGDAGEAEHEREKGESGEWS